MDTQYNTVRVLIRAGLSDEQVETVAARLNLFSAHTGAGAGVRTMVGTVAVGGIFWHAVLEDRGFTFALHFTNPGGVPPYPTAVVEAWARYVLHDAGVRPTAVSAIRSSNTKSRENILLKRRNSAVKPETIVLSRR